jgi:hypothetical protein
MAAHDTPPPVTLPATSVILLAELLTQMDEFLRSSPLIADDLAGFLASRDHSHPGFAAFNLIDNVSFTALWLRNLIAAGQARPEADPGQ